MKKKAELVASIKTQLAKWKTEIDGFKDKIEDAEDELKEKIHRKIAKLEEKHREAELHANDDERLGHEGWEELKTAYEDLQKDLEETIAHAQLPHH